MNPEAWKYLEQICVKEPHELNDAEVGFLKARRMYLNGDQLAKYASVLDMKVESVELDDYSKIEGLSFKEMNLEQLKIAGKHYGIRGAHLFKDANQLRTQLLALNH